LNAWEVDTTTCLDERVAAACLRLSYATHATPAWDTWEDGTACCHRLPLRATACRLPASPRACYAACHLPAWVSAFLMNRAPRWVVSTPLGTLDACLHALRQRACLPRIPCLSASPYLPGLPPACHRRTTFFLLGVPWVEHLPASYTFLPRFPMGHCNHHLQEPVHHRFYLPLFILHYTRFSAACHTLECQVYKPLTLNTGLPHCTFVSADRHPTWVWIAPLFTACLGLRSRLQQLDMPAGRCCTAALPPPAACSYDAAARRALPLTITCT